MPAINIEVEGKTGALLRIVEEHQERNTVTHTNRGYERKQIHTKVLVLNIYEHFAGAEMTFVKAVRIGNDDSSYYLSERQEAFEKALAWAKKR